MHCHKNPNREKSIKLMVTTILKDDHASRPAFASCLEQYLQSPGQQIQFHNEKFPGRLHATLQEAIEEQTLIGWHHLLLGYASKKWLLIASMDTPTIGQINLSAGRSRKKVALRAITLMVRDLWLGRNEILHQHQDDQDQTIYSMESAERRHYHSNPTLVPNSDQHYCRNITLSKLLKSRPSVRRRWLKRVKTARAAYLKDSKNQQLVTRYMKPLPSTKNSTNIPGAQRMQRNPANRTTRPTHTNTAQQRMTAFFPGQPPDNSNTTSQNPPPSQL